MKNNTLKQHTFMETVKARWELWLLLAPFLILFILLTVVPVVSSIVLSFFDFDMVSLPSWSGVDNYLRAFIQDDLFPIVLKNTLVLAVLTGPVGFLLSFVLAWLINEFRPGVRTLLSFMFYVPALIGNGLFIWQIIFNSDSFGYANSLLLSAGLITAPITWLSTESYIVPIVVAVQLWQSMGVSFLANISGLQNINQELFEAGAVDGIRNRCRSCGTSLCRACSICYCSARLCRLPVLSPSAAPSPLWPAIPPSTMRRIQSCPT